MHLGTPRCWYCRRGGVPQRGHQAGATRLDQQRSEGSRFCLQRQCPHHRLCHRARLSRHTLSRMQNSCLSYCKCKRCTLTLDFWCCCACADNWKASRVQSISLSYCKAGRFVRNQSSATFPTVLLHSCCRLTRKSSLGWAPTSLQTVPRSRTRQVGSCVQASCVQSRCLRAPQ